MNSSVQRRLSLALALAVVLVALAAGIFSFFVAYGEARELQDDLLRQIAQLVDRRQVAAVPLPRDEHLGERDDGSRVIVQRLGEPNPAGLHVDEGGALPLPVTLADGLHTLEAGGESFRVLVRTTARGERIAVAQESDFRDDIARDSALHTLVPFLVLVPVLLLVLSGLVRKMFDPIAALAAEVDRRGEHDLRAFDEGPVPGEVRPFVAAINRLLARLTQAIEAQRRFVADAAHELRSPLTALSLQAGRLGEAPMSDAARERLAALHGGIARGRSLLEQLLALARAQSAAATPPASVSIRSVYRRVLEELVPLAADKRIDLGVEGAVDAAVWASELDLFTLIRNLVDNAIRYTPPGGRVDLWAGVEDAQAVLRISDNGPGIAQPERDQIFAPFYRALGNEQTGSGLGLAIVQTIARRIGARVELGYTDEDNQAGLTVVVRLALAAAPAAPPTLSGR